MFVWGCPLNRSVRGFSHFTLSTHAPNTSFNLKVGLHARGYATTYMALCSIWYVIIIHLHKTQSQ
jgi:hypothetical protein